MIGMSVHPNGTARAQVTYYRRTNVAALLKIIAQATRAESMGSDRAIISIDNLIIAKRFTPFDWRDIRSSNDAARVLEWFRTRRARWHDRSN
jgi:hypothetical protein